LHLRTKVQSVGRITEIRIRGVAAIVAGIYINNTNLLIKHHGAKPILLAHRGMAQRFDEHT